MIYEILKREIKNQKDEFNVTYYIEIRKSIIEIIYEYVGLYMYDYRKYTIKLNYNVKNEYLILENVMKNIEKIYNNFSETRKLAIIAKYVTYVISKNLNIPIYKLIRKVQYEANGEITELSINAFIKSTYRLINRFEKLLS